MSRLALVLLGALLLLPGLGRMGAMDSTDARYLAIAREMAHTNEWLVPRLGGATHLDKPPLTYWASMLGERALGANEFGGRAGQQLALIATALVVAAAARRLAGPQWSLAAGLAFLTAGLPFALSRGVATDLFQLAFVTPALLLLHEASQRRSSARTALAFALLGASMWAKGPIAAMVAGAVWLAAMALGRARGRLPWRGIALGVVLFLAIGLPWYVLIAARVPGVTDWFAAQLAGRVTGSGVGHVKDATYIVRSWGLGLLPWTPVVLLSLWRLWPRRGRRDADPCDAFVIAWALAPVLLFSLFKTKLASYVVPAVPGAVLVVARAGARGLLDDRRARRVLALCYGTALAATLALGLAVGAESLLGWDTLPFFALHDARVPRCFGAVLLTTALLGAALLPRVARLDARGSLIVTALVSGLALASMFHAVAGDLPTFREEGRIVRRVPGARLVEFAFQPGLFYYAEPAATVFVAGVGGLIEPLLDPASAQRLSLSREEGLAMLREDVPTFALVDTWQAPDLAALAGTRILRESRKYALIANPAALRALDREAATP